MKARIVGDSKQVRSVALLTDDESGIVEEILR
jgi:hypothetical protein